MKYSQILDRWPAARHDCEDGSVIKADDAALGPIRESPAHGIRMTFSAPTGFPAGIERRDRDIGVLHLR